MVAWSTSGSFVVSKGENVDVKTLSSNGVVIPCFFAFDILLLNDEELSHLPLKVLYLLFYAVCTLIDFRCIL